MRSVYGMGNPLMDVMVSGDHELLQRLGVTAGSMNLVEPDIQEQVVAGGTVVSRKAGGSCANTMRALAWLSRRGPWRVSLVYTGAVGHDEEGDRFERILRDESVFPLLSRKAASTGRSVILVTPDSERTMFTHLGACRELGSDDVASDRIAGTSVFHTTGYMWDTPNQEQAAKAAILRARLEGVSVSFDVADPFVARRYAADLREWLPGRIDLLFANREELAALAACEGTPEEILDAAARFAPVVVMKVGKEGCYLGCGGEARHVPGSAAETHDTTGAGDSFAGGFLYGHVAGVSPAECAALANRLAAGVVEVSGCDFSQLRRERVLEGLI